MVVKKSLKKYNSWCTPAKIYVGLAVLSTIMSLVGALKYDQVNNGGDNLFGLSIGHLVMVVFWTWVLLTLCKKSYHKTAWAVLLFPYIIVLFIFLTLKKMDTVEGLESGDNFIIILVLGLLLPLLLLSGWVSYSQYINL